MAALLTEELDLPVELVVGRSGEFTVWVDAVCVAKKSLDGFPSDQECVDAVARALIGTGSSSPAGGSSPSQ